MMARAVTRALAGLATLALAAPPALAAGGGFVMKQNGFYIIDFIVLVGLLWYFGVGPARAFMVKRHDTVREEMEEAAALKADAADRLARYEKMLSDLQGEITRLREDFHRDGVRERAQIEADTEALAKRIRHDTAVTLSRETTQMRLDLERELSTFALARAQELIAERLNAKTRQQLVHAFIEDLENRDDIGTLSA